MTSKRKPSGYWNVERIISELDIITNELGYFPSGIQLRRMNKGDLKAAIDIRGGTLKFRMIYSNMKNRNEMMC